MILRLETCDHKRQGRHSVLQRILCSGTLVLFCFSITCLYIAAPVACLDHPHGDEIRDPHIHSHVAQSHSEEDDAAFYFQHCKEFDDGMGAGWVPFGMPLTILFATPAESRIVSAAEALRLPESFPSSLFHPPKRLG
ncbi:MAG: hypothetical protein HY648_13975 [Acidobacteria bacterium]|nr:hypothetical protein [Acidobacteriota bacterium]